MAIFKGSGINIIRVAHMVCGTVVLYFSIKMMHGDG